eukprot:gene17789-9467_t
MNKHEKQIKQRIVHLDLKGAPPKMQYLLRIIPLMRQWGATGILVEYEDTFPFKDELSYIAKEQCYSSEDIKSLQDVSKTEGMEFIPLIQTFGHMEYVLKHKECAHLRELKENPMSICPKNEDSLPLIKSLIDQIMAEHEDLKYLHIGGDEVFCFCQCKACVEACKTISKERLYTNHMISIINYISTKWPALQILIWDDMFREFSICELEELSGNGSIVIPVVWSYVGNLNDVFPNGMFERFGEAFEEIWIASSFKGSAGPSCDWTPMPHYINNHLSWLSLINQLPKETKKKVKAIMVTGWSRYDHYATLCELLPAALPCLAMCLAVLKEGLFNKSIHEKVSRNLGYLQCFQLEYKPFMQLDSNCGNFPGSEIITYVTHLEHAKHHLKMAEERKESWMDTWHIEVKKDVNICHIEFACTMLNSALQIYEGIRSPLQECLSFHFDSDTVEEFIVVKVNSQVKKILDLLSLMRSIKQMCCKNFVADDQT